MTFLRVLWGQPVRLLSWVLKIMSCLWNLETLWQALELQWECELPWAAGGPCLGLTWDILGRYGMIWLWVKSRIPDSHTCWCWSGLVLSHHKLSLLTHAPYPHRFALMHCCNVLPGCSTMVLICFDWHPETCFDCVPNDLNRSWRQRASPFFRSLYEYTVDPICIHLQWYFFGKWWSTIGLGGFFLSFLGLGLDEELNYLLNYLLITYSTTCYTKIASEAVQQVSSARLFRGMRSPMGRMPHGLGPAPWFFLDGLRPMVSEWLVVLKNDVLKNSMLDTWDDYPLVSSG